MLFDPKWVAHHIFDDKGKKMGIGDLHQGPMGSTWIKSTTYEMGRLSDSIPGRVRGTNPVRWIHKKEIPAGFSLCMLIWYATIAL